MKAITQRTYGTPDVLTFDDQAHPRLGAHDVLVEVHASAITHADRRLRAGDFPGIAWLPGRIAMGFAGPRKAIPGTNFAGRVVAVGPEVSRFAVGADVFGGVLHGAHAELMAISEAGAIAPMPSGLSYEQAAALPYGAVTALHFLRDLGKLERGQRVCILGASGGVGRFAVQIARHLGAEVTAVCSARNHDLVRSLGADHVVDYERQDFRDTDRPYDVVLDTLGTSRFDRCRRALTPTGRYLSLVVSARGLLQMIRTALFGGQRALIGVAPVRRHKLDDVRAMIELGAITPLVDRVYSLERIADAHARLESGRAQGAVIVSPARGPAELSAAGAARLASCRASA